MQKNWKPVSRMQWQLNHKSSTAVIYTAIILVLLTAVSGRMWLNSISLILFCIVCFINFDKAAFEQLKRYQWLLACCFLFFLIHLIPWITTKQTADSWFAVEKKAAFAFVPVFFMFLIPIQNPLKNKIFLTAAGFTAILFFYLLICAATAFFNHQSGTEVFFYHGFLKPIGHHAVYLSSYISIILFYLLQVTGTAAGYKGWCRFLLLILLIFLILLASKTILTITAVIACIEIFIQSSVTKKRKLKLIIAAGAVLIFILFTVIKNPLRNRFQEVANTDLNILSKTKYKTDMYFNAVQFRLVAWKFSWLLVQESGNYLTGIGAAHAQQALNKKYREANMYTGESSEKEGGYLNLNAHNQFVQTFLQSGITGLALLLMFLFSLFRAAVIQKNKVLLYCCIVISLFFCTESVLEGQYGIILCLFFPFLLFVHPPPDRKPFL